MTFFIGKQKSLLSFTSCILISSGSESRVAWLCLRTLESEKSLPYHIGDGYSPWLFSAAAFSSRNTLSIIWLSFSMVELASVFWSFLFDCLLLFLFFLPFLVLLFFCRKKISCVWFNACRYCISSGFRRLFYRPECVVFSFCLFCNCSHRNFRCHRRTAMGGRMPPI